MAEGKNPDEQEPTGRPETVREGNAHVRREVTESGWRKYEKEARRFVAALDAANI